MQKIKKDEENGKNRKIRLMFCDEARFGLIDAKCRSWAPAGVRPAIFMRISRQYFYAYAAVCPADGAMVGVTLPWANAECMNAFLDAVSKRFPDELVVLIMDQARWHKAKALVVPKNVKIEFLPPYSPQLNPTENIWDEIREKHFKNRYFATMDEVDDQLFHALKLLSENPKKVASIAGFKWIFDAI